eukprot:COSAG05_NODE_26031_length_191_cov_58.565217_1_plen_53_part_10
MFYSPPVVVLVIFSVLTHGGGWGGAGRGMGVLFCVQVLPLGFFERVHLRLWVG